jgi:HAE1 family hydrophobic/amphiphilic exporter-1
MIVGIVAKNAILLVDFTNQARARGVPREEALRLAGPLRFRPILMTSLTVMASMVPVMMALGEGGEQRAPMGASVFGGVLTSTLLTLLVIPCAYSVMDDLSLFTRRLFSRHAQHEAHTQEAAEKEPMATATGGPATEAE